MLLTTDTLVFVAEDLDQTQGAPGLVQAREARDRARFEEEALTHADQLYRIALRLTGSPTAAEDLVQEAYLRAFRSWRSFTPGTNLAAWLATILRNVNLDAVRKQNRRPKQESIDEQGDYYLYNRLSEAPGAATGRGARPAWRCGCDRGFDGGSAAGISGGGGAGGHR